MEFIAEVQIKELKFFRRFLGTNIERSPNILLREVAGDGEEDSNKLQYIEYSVSLITDGEKRYSHKIEKSNCYFLAAHL